MTTCERFHNSGIDEPHECVFEGITLDIPALEADELPPPGATRSTDPVPIPTGYRYQLMKDHLEEVVGPGFRTRGPLAPPLWGCTTKPLTRLDTSQKASRGRK